MKSWTLKNGAQLFYEPNGLPHLSAIAVDINRGAFKEPVPGLAHLLEHSICVSSGLAFNAEAAEKSGDVIEHFNAKTGLSRTQYELGSLNEDFRRLGTRVLDSIFSNPLSDESIEHDKEVILREIVEHHGNRNPEQEASLKLGSAFFGSEWYGYDAIGTKESVLSTSPQTVRAFRDDAYTPANAKIYIAGKLRRADFEAMFNTIESYPRGIERTVEKIPFTLPVKPVTLDTTIPGNPELAYLQLTFERPATERTDGLAYGIISRSLFGDEGRLMTLFREKMRATYGMTANQISFADATGQYVGIPCKPENIEQTRELLFGEFEKLQTEGLRDTELARIQKQLRIQLLANRNSSNWDIINDMTSAVKFGISNKQYLNELRKIKPDEVIHTARRYLPTKDSPYVMQIVRHQ